MSEQNDNHRAADALDRLTDFLAEDILESSEQDRRDEAADENDEITRLAAGMKSLFPGRVYELYLQHVSRSQGNVIPFPNLPLPGLSGGEATAAAPAAETTPPAGVLSQAAPAPQRTLPRWCLALGAVFFMAAGATCAMLCTYYSKRVMVAFLDDPPRVDVGYHFMPALEGAGIPSAGTGNDACRANSPALQLAAGGPTAMLAAGMPAPLGLTIDRPSDGAQLVICGFAPGSVISAGQRLDERTWVVPASGLAEAALIPPPDFIGLMKLDAVLVNADKTVADRRTLRLQWLPSTAAGQQLEEGARLQAAGDLVRARAIFLRLALSGNARAAFLLAESYDPIALARRQPLPSGSDVEKARTWYRKALEQGSQEANSRLERLSNW